VLERGEIALRFAPETGELSLWYYEHRLPIRPAEYPRVLLANLLPILKPLAVRLVGYGFRPERIDDAVLDPLSSADSPRPTPGTPA